MADQQDAQVPLLLPQGSNTFETIMGIEYLHLIRSQNEEIYKWEQIYLQFIIRKGKCEKSNTMTVDSISLLDYNRSQDQAAKWALSILQMPDSTSVKVPQHHQGYKSNNTHQNWQWNPVGHSRSPMKFVH